MEDQESLQNSLGMSIVNQVPEDWVSIQMEATALEDYISVSGIYWSSTSGEQKAIIPTSEMVAKIEQLHAHMVRNHGDDWEGLVVNIDSNGSIELLFTYKGEEDK